MGEKIMGERFLIALEGKAMLIGMAFYESKSEIPREDGFDEGALPQDSPFLKFDTVLVEIPQEGLPSDAEDAMMQIMKIPLYRLRFNAEIILIKDRARFLVFLRDEGFALPQGKEKIQPPFLPKARRDEADIRGQVLFGRKARDENQAH